MKRVFPAEWRTQTRWKRRFYARYMKALERAGYALVALVFVAFVAAFNIRVEDVVSADKVAIVPFTQPTVVGGPTLVVRALATDGDAVRRGQPLFEIVTGEDEIERELQWLAIQALPESPEKAALAARADRPRIATLVAPGDGTFRLDAQPGTRVEAKGVLGRVVDYGDLRVEASLAGDTVAGARAEDPARVVNIAVDPVGGTILRGGGIVSGQILGENAKMILGRALVGRAVRLRDDVPLRVTEVKEIQVDADLPSSAGGQPGGVLDLDPPADLKVAAQVVEGSPAATVQVADLPADLVRSVGEQVRLGVRGRVVRAADGAVRTLGDPSSTRLVVKLKAGVGPGEGEPLPGTMLARTFDAKLRLIDPPKFLLDAVRAADAAGRAVTCRVELRTGERPIALRLLKKS